MGSHLMMNGLNSCSLERKWGFEKELDGRGQTSTNTCHMLISNRSLAVRGSRRRSAHNTEVSSDPIAPEPTAEDRLLKSPESPPKSTLPVARETPPDVARCSCIACRN